LSFFDLFKQPVQKAESFFSQFAHGAENAANNVVQGIAHTQIPGTGVNVGQVAQQIPHAAAQVGADVAREVPNIVSNAATGITKVAAPALLPELNSLNNNQTSNILDAQNKSVQQKVSNILDNVGVPKSGNTTGDVIAKAVPNLLSFVAPGEAGSQVGTVAEGLAKAGFGLKSLDSLHAISELNPAVGKTILNTVLNPQDTSLAAKVGTKAANVVGNTVGFTAANNVSQGQDQSQLPKQVAQNLPLFAGGEAALVGGGKLASKVGDLITSAQKDGVPGQLLDTLKTNLTNEHGATVLGPEGDVNKISEKTPQQQLTDTAANAGKVAETAPVATEATPAQKFSETVNPTPTAGSSPTEVTPTSKLLDALQGAKAARGQLDKAQSAALSQRVAAGQNILNRGSGEAGFSQAKRALSGPLVQDKPLLQGTSLNQNDVNSLYDQIKSNPDLRFFEQVRTANALGKVLNGEVPTKGELGLVQHVFGSDVTKAVLDQRSTGEKVRQTLTDVANIPRSLLSSIDFSAPLRQGLVLSARHPVMALKAGDTMFKQAFSEDAFNGWLDNYQKSPNFQVGKDAGLHITDPRNVAGGLGAREEAFMSSLAEKIPVIGRLIAGSERGYVGFLNKLRADSFDSLYKGLQEQGITDDKTVKAMADFINAATGRGKLGSLEKIAPELNATLFSPRLISSRLTFLNPVWYAKQPPTVRKQAIQAFASLLGIGTTVMTLAHAAGAQVGLDPRSSDFGKIQVGNTRWDIWGGFAQYVRVAAQEVTGQKVTNGVAAKADRLSTAVNFARGKLAPAPGTALDVAEGTNVVGQKVTPGSIAGNLLVPFNVQDTVAAQKDLGTTGAVAAAVPGTFGVGVNTYTPKTPSRSSSTKSSTGGNSSKATGSVRKSAGSRKASSRSRITKGSRIKSAHAKVRVAKGHRAKSSGKLSRSHKKGATLHV
jgi:hypothetical protein